VSARRADALRKGAACGLVLAAAAAWSWPAARGTRTLQERICGPLAASAAALQWTRAESAVRRGALGTGLAHARDALRCTPRSGPLWEQYARLLALHLGSTEREPDAGRRRAWLSAGLAALDEGERNVGDRGGFALARAFVLLAKAEVDPELGWPGGSDALERDALSALEQARAAGNSVATALLAAEPPSPARSGAASAVHDDP
jgi:hypothetical protein